MEWLQQNWFWVVVFVAFFAMHLFGHGGHGRHGGSGGCGDSHERRPPGMDEKRTGPPPSGHQH